ncbi:MAG: S8 family serine peptidase [Acetivibrio sp.]
MNKKRMVSSLLCLILLFQWNGYTPHALAKETETCKVRTLVTQDKFSNLQWAYYDLIENINIEEAWKLSKDAENEVTVAIIDTGIDYLHADLAPNMWVNEDEVMDSSLDNDENGYEGDYYGWNFVDENAEICNYEKSSKTGLYADIHGTHVAGIIGAVADNGIGIAGVAAYSKVKLMSCKALGSEGEGNMSAIIEAIEYAENNGASICNLSLGTSDYSKALYKAIKNSKMLFVCAAGNGTKDTNMQGYDISKSPVYPAGYQLDNIITVANTNNTGQLDSSSCYSNEYVDIAAPGTSIVSAYVDEEHTPLGRYVKETGTSMAAPFVTGTAAMIASYYGNLPANVIKKMILGGSRKVDALCSKVRDGAFLDVYGAMSYKGMMASVQTEVTDLPYSNYKKCHVTIENPMKDTLTLRYAKGNQDLSYFQQGEKGEAFEWKENKTTKTIKETTEYTVYLRDSLGNEQVYTEKIVVPKLTGIKLSTTKKTLKKGEKFRLEAAIKESNAYASIVYDTSNPKVAKVSSSGNVAAKNKGTTTITVTAIDGNTVKKAKCKVTVK